MKAFYDQQPERLTIDNDGTYLFRWNIKKITEEKRTQWQEEKRTGWQCDEVRCFGNPDIDKVKLAIIRDSYDADREFSIINKYNSHKLGVTVNPDAVDNYTEYLTFLKEIDEELQSGF